VKKNDPIIDGRTCNVRTWYGNLLRKSGPQGWWPTTAAAGKHAQFEICVGAILTQNTSWTNVTKVIRCLYTAGLMDPRKIISASDVKLQRCVRSSGYFRQKTKKLQIFSKWLVKNYRGDLKRFFKIDLNLARRELLTLWGIGEETADSILLYAGQKPTFIIDAYTRRFCAKQNVRFKIYGEYQKFFENGLRGVKERVKVYQEFHALLVAWGKNIAKHG